MQRGLGVVAALLAASLGCVASAGATTVNSCLARKLSGVGLSVYALAIIPLYIVSIMYQFLTAQNRNGLWTGFLTLTVGLYALVSVLLTPWTLHHYGNGVLGTISSFATTTWTPNA